MPAAWPVARMSALLTPRVRRRDARVGQRAEGRGDAGQDAERHAGARQRQRLLAAAAEDVRVAALQAQHPRAARRARPTSSALIAACGVEGWPRRLPTKCSSAAAAARSAAGSTSAS